MGGLVVREMGPRQFQGNLGWWNIIIWPEYTYIYIYIIHILGVFWCPFFFFVGGGNLKYSNYWLTIIVFQMQKSANSNWLEAVTDGWCDGYRSIAGDFNAFSFTSRIGDELNLFDFCIFFQMVHIFQMSCFTPELKINSFGGVKSSSCPIKPANQAIQGWIGGVFLKEFLQRTRRLCTSRPSRHVRNGETSGHVVSFTAGITPEEWMIGHRSWVKTTITPSLTAVKP